jgi:hypothetical protein
MDDDLTLAEEMIDAWHENNGFNGMELHDYLGLSDEQANDLLRDPQALDDAVRKAMEALREVHMDYTDRSDEHRMYCLADGQLWPCEDGRKAWHELYPDEFPLISE